VIPKNAMLEKIIIVHSVTCDVSSHASHSRVATVAMPTVAVVKTVTSVEFS
jgi:hypothetical protein